MLLHRFLCGTTQKNPLLARELQVVLILQRVAQQRIRALQAQLAANGGAVVLDSPIVNGKFRSDLLAGFIGGNQLQNPVLDGLDR